MSLAFLFGEIVMNITGMQGIMCISVIYFLVLFILRKHLKSNVFVKFFAFLFVLFIFGSIRMKIFDDRLTQYDVYDDGDSISVHGEITDIYEKQYGYALCVRDNDIYHYVYINSLEGLAIGYVVSIEGEFVAMKKPRNPGNFNQKK